MMSEGEGGLYEDRVGSVGSFPSTRRFVCSVDVEEEAMSNVVLFEGEMNMLAKTSVQPPYDAVLFTSVRSTSTCIISFGTTTMNQGPRSANDPGACGS